MVEKCIGSILADSIARTAASRKSRISSIRELMKTRFLGISQPLSCYIIYLWLFLLQRTAQRLALAASGRAGIRIGSKENSKPEKSSKNAQNPTCRLHAVLARYRFMGVLRKFASAGRILAVLGSGFPHPIYDCVLSLVASEVTLCLCHLPPRRCRLFEVLPDPPRFLTGGAPSQYPPAHRSVRLPPAPFPSFSAVQLHRGRSRNHTMGMCTDIPVLPP